MTLLTMVFAAIISTIIWYCNAPKSQMKIGTLCLMYWGASLLWLVDSILGYLEIHDENFTPAPIDMPNDFYPGLSVIALGLVI